MTFFTASFETVLYRFLLMMATVIGSFLTGVPFLAILALPIFLSAMVAVSFTTPKTEKQAQMTVNKPAASESLQAA